MTPPIFDTGSFKKDKLWEMRYRYLRRHFNEVHVHVFVTF